VTVVGVDCRWVGGDDYDDDYDDDDILLSSRYHQHSNGTK